MVVFSYVLLEVRQSKKGTWRLDIDMIERKFYVINITNKSLSGAWQALAGVFAMHPTIGFTGKITFYNYRLLSASSALMVLYLNLNHFGFTIFPS